MVPTEPRLPAAWYQHSFPWNQTLEVHLTLFTIFRLSEDSATSTIFGVPMSDGRALTGLGLPKVWRVTGQVESVQRERTAAGAAALPKAWPGAAAGQLLPYCSSVQTTHLLFPCTGSCMRAHSRSRPGASSAPDSTTQGLRKAAPQSLPTALGRGTSQWPRPKAPEASSRKFKQNKWRCTRQLLLPLT